MVYLKSVENVITLGKLIGLLFLFCLPLLSILFLKTKRNDLARPVMGTIFLVYTVLPALRANSCIAIDRLMIELLDFHIPFLSFTNAGFKGYGKNLLNRRLRITLLP